MSSLELETERRARQAALRLERAAHPDIVALRVERWRVIVTGLIWAGLVIGLAYTVQNVQQFAVHVGGYAVFSMGWWASWLLEPSVALVLIGVLLAERLTSPERIPLAGRTRLIKVALIGCTYGMNTWLYWAAGDSAGIFLHTVPVVVVLAAAEVLPDLNDKLTALLQQKFTDAEVKRDAKRRAKEAAADLSGSAPAGGAPVRQSSAVQASTTQTGTTVPVGPSAAPAFRAVPNWSPAVGSDGLTDRPGRPGDTSRDAAAGRPAPATRDVSPSGSGTSRAPAGETSRGTSGGGRSGRSARRPARPRSDSQLADDVRRLAESNGGEPPSAHKVKQELGVGHDRAQRLLAELATAGPSGPPETNGRGEKGGHREP